jgi:uncharacterized protein with PQ loop repeat
VSEFFGWFGSAMLLVCSMPQAYRSIKQGHSDGLSASMLWLWIGGMVFMLFYLVPLAAWPAVISHVVNIVVAGTITWFYYFPRRVRSLQV